MVPRTKFLLIFATTLLFLTSITYTQTDDPLKRGLIGYYSFNDNDAMDESGNENHGETDGVVLEKDISGERNGSYKWDDEDDYIKLPIDISAMTLPKVTLSAWVYPQSYNGEITVISNEDWGGDRKIYTPKLGKKRVWAISDGKGGFIGKTHVVNNKWVFVVATYDEGSKRASIYVDGVKTSGKTKMDMSADYTMIGANTKRNDDFEALIDEVRIYDRILSKSEINSLRKLQTEIDDFKKKEKTRYYLPKQNNLIVRAGATKDAKVLGKLSTADTLRSKIQVPSKGGRWNEWLKIDYKGKVGYVQLSYLDVRTVEGDNLSDFEKMAKEYMNWGNWVFWVIMILFLAIGIGGSAGFGGIDGMLNAITGNDFDGNIAFFPILTGFSGFILAILMVIWQDGIEYYLFENFSYLPSGYGFAAWIVWIVLVVNILVFVFMIFESLTCGNIIHGILRIIIQLVLAVFTLYSVFAITIALIIIVIIIMVVGLLLAGFFSVRYVRE
ncbi:MAG: hypothetical protein PF445_08565 [Melioribacteraceae bacterium]|jgi:hypothetical protein|nr:hypothetical protein [Melioribacteraceae bacterium]